MWRELKKVKYIFVLYRYIYRLADSNLAFYVGGHINPAVTFGMLLARKVTLNQAVMYMLAQCLGAISGVGLVKALQEDYYFKYGGGANIVSDGYSKGVGLGAEIIGTFVLVYTVFTVNDPERKATDSHVPVCTLIFLQFKHVIWICECQISSLDSS